MRGMQRRMNMTAATMPITDAGLQPRMFERPGEMARGASGADVGGDSDVLVEYLVAVMDRDVVVGVDSDRINVVVKDCATEDGDVDDMALCNVLRRNSQSPLKACQ